MKSGLDSEKPDLIIHCGCEVRRLIEAEALDTPCDTWSTLHHRVIGHTFLEVCQRQLELDVVTRGLLEHGDERRQAKVSLREVETPVSDQQHAHAARSQQPRVQFQRVEAIPITALEHLIEQPGVLKRGELHTMRLETGVTHRQLL